MEAFEAIAAGKGDVLMLFLSSILPGSAGKHGKRHIKREAGEPIPRVTSDNRTFRNLDERVREGIELRALNCPHTTGERNVSTTMRQPELEIKL